MTLTKLRYFILKKPFDFAAFSLGAILGIVATILLTMTLLLLPIYHSSHDKLKGLDWTSIITALLAFAALIITVTLYRLDNKYKKSEFSLKEIKENFDKAISLINAGSNNNIKWHQAIDLLKVSDIHLKTLVASVPHQMIYITSYIDAAYIILDIIKDIDSIEFFYGADLEKSYKSQTRISPESLKWLCVFIEKANKARFNVHALEGRLEDVFNATYFVKENTGDLADLSGFMTLKMGDKLPPLHFILEYIRHIESTIKN